MNALPVRPQNKLYVWIKLAMVVALGITAGTMYAQRQQAAKVEQQREGVAVIRGKPIVRRSTNALETAAGQNLGPAETSAVQVTLVPNSPVAPPLGESTPTVAGFSEVGFEKLSSFSYVMPDDMQAPTNAPVVEKDQIPEKIKAFHRKPIALRGFMLPLKVEAGLVTEMLIMRDQSMCCYGTVPKINEWVSVKMTGKGVKAVMDQPVILYGTLRVGEVRENGYLTGIYQLDGVRMEEPATP